MLSVATLSHPGAVRPTNEDAVLWEPQLGLLAIADGLGGHNAGEVASQLALDALRRALQTTISGRDAEWPFGFAEDLSVPANRLLTAVRLANREVFHTGQERTECAGMGTTLTAVLIEDARVWFASVGDSRLYSRLSGEAGLRQMTRDDSLAAMIAGTQEATAADVNHAMRNLLTSVLGTREHLNVEVEEVVLTDGQLLLMTTDGMHADVGDEVMDAILDASIGADLEVAAEHLVEAALGAGGRDNITLALARYSVAP